MRDDGLNKSCQYELLNTGWSGKWCGRGPNQIVAMLQSEWCTEVASRAHANLCNPTFWHAGVTLCPASHGRHCHRVNDFSQDVTEYTKPTLR